VGGVELGATEGLAVGGSAGVELGVTEGLDEGGGLGVELRVTAGLAECMPLVRRSKNKDKSY
jgi:hypothetical protein